MALIHDIRNQPRHIRKLMFGLSVITTVSLVGMIWFNSFQNNMYALLNPAEENPDQSQFAQAPQVKSPLASMKDAFKSAGASIMGLFGSEKDAEIQPTPFEGKARSFPLSE